MPAKILKHRFQSADVDGSDPTQIRPSNWNDEHDFWLGTRTVISAVDTITNADHLSVIKYNATATVAVSLAAPASGNMRSGWKTTLMNAGGGVVTLNGTGGATINGAPSVPIAKGQYLDLISDGTANYGGMPDLLATPATPAGSQTTFTQIGLRGQNKAANPLYEMEFATDELVLRNAAGNSVRIINASGSCWIASVGADVNGRDQAAEFSGSSWSHFYWIYNQTSSTLATICSLIAPPMGPALPSGYTYWAYIGPVRLDVDGHLFPVILRGATIFYQDHTNPVLISGAALAETAVSVAAFVPPNAGAYNCMYYSALQPTTPLYSFTNAYLRVASGINYFTVFGVTSQWEPMLVIGVVEIPNVGQNMYFLIASSGASLWLYIMSYTVPNGAC